MCSSIQDAATSVDLLSSSDLFNEHKPPEEGKSKGIQSEAGFSLTLRFSPPRLYLLAAVMKEAILPDFSLSFSIPLRIPELSATRRMTALGRQAVSRRSSSTKTVPRVPRRVRMSHKVTVSVKLAADFCCSYLHQLPGVEFSAEKVFSRGGQHLREPFKSFTPNKEILCGRGGEPRPSSKESKQQLSRKQLIKWCRLMLRYFSRISGGEQPSINLQFRHFNSVHLPCQSAITRYSLELLCKLASN